MVCDEKDNTVSWFFKSDRDGNGNGTTADDIFIPSQSRVLLPGVLVDNVPTIMMPDVNAKGPGQQVKAPHWSAKGGEIPSDVRPLVSIGEESLRTSLREKGIPDGIQIKTVFRGSGNDFRMGSGIITPDGTAMFFPKFDDNIDGFAWRPDLQLPGRQWHWEKITLPKGVNGKIDVFIDEASDVPQMVVLTADGSRMIGWFNNTTGVWETPDGKILSKETVPTNTPTATKTPTSTSTFTPSPTFTSTMTLTPSRTPTVTTTPTITMTPSPTRAPFIERPDLEAVPLDTWDKCANKTSEVPSYWMQKARNDYETTLSKEGKTIDAVVSAFKAGGKYEKPNFLIIGSQRTPDGGVSIGSIASTLDAVAIGSGQCTINNATFGGKTGLSINVNVGYFIPFDSPGTVIAVVMNVTYSDDGVRDGTTVLGARGIHTASGAMQLEPNLKMVWCIVCEQWRVRITLVLLRALYQMR